MTDRQRFKGGRARHGRQDVLRHRRTQIGEVWRAEAERQELWMQPPQRARVLQRLGDAGHNLLMGCAFGS